MSGTRAGVAPVFELRPATAEDLELCYAITKDAMRAYAEATWGPWIDDEQRPKHADLYTPLTHRIVQVGAEPAGLVAVEDLPDHRWLVKLYLLARHRGSGIGSALLRQVLDEAAAAGKPVRLRVLRVNTRARALYERNGFRVFDQTPERLFMIFP